MLTHQHWREDLRYLVEVIEAHGKSLPQSFSKTEHPPIIDKFEVQMSVLSEHQIIVRIAQLAAVLSEGRIDFAIPINPTIAFQRFPIQVNILNGKVIVTATSTLYQDLMCHQVLEIGGFPIDHVKREIACICPCITAQSWEDDVLSHALIPEVLHALGMIEDTAKAEFCIAMDGDERQIVEVEAVPFDWDTTRAASSELQRRQGFWKPSTFPEYQCFELPNSEIQGIYYGINVGFKQLMC